jgi:hypothetical protein
MRPVAFGEALPAGTRLTLFSDDKPDCFFTVIKFWRDKPRALQSHSRLAFLPTKSRRPAAPKAGGRQNSLLIQLPIEEEEENRSCLWRPDHAGFDPRSIFEGALVEE